MQKIIPKTLQKGDTIGFLTVAGSLEDNKILQRAKEEFEVLGYNVVISETSYTKKNYLCASDEKRANMLNEFFADDSIDAIIATRGGYGSIRLLDKIDYELIKSKPKIFGGYSDITALMLMVYKNTGLVTYNMPMAYSDFGKGITQYSAESFFRVLNGNFKEIIIDEPKIYYAGSASGVLWGGNLATIQSLCGLEFVPDEKFIFITEEINEPVYKIDKMFTQLLNIEKFKNNLGAIVLGDFINIDNQQYLEMFFDELAQSLKIPIISGIKYGHETNKQTVPIGIDVILDTNLKKMIIN